MRGSLALVLCGLATTACAAPQQPARLSATELFRTACMDTPAERPAFEALGRDKGWALLPFTPGEQGPDWGVGYGLGYARIMLTEYKAKFSKAPPESEHAGARLMVVPSSITCRIEVIDPQEDWRAEIAALAQARGFTAVEVSQTPPEPVELREWERNATDVLSQAYNPSTRMLSVNLMRLTETTFRRAPSTPE